MNQRASETLESHSEEETVAFGEAIGRSLEAGNIVLISGELGAGKTRLVQGIARGLDTKRIPRSPTFVLVNQHEGRLTLHHSDLYRINGPAEVDDLGLLEAASDGGVLAVEWADRARAAFPDDCLEVRLSRGETPDDRHISMVAGGGISTELLQKTLNHVRSRAQI